MEHRRFLPHREAHRPFAFGDLFAQIGGRVAIEAWSMGSTNASRPTLRCVRYSAAISAMSAREMAILTNLPRSAADAIAVANLYRKRWTLETMFQSLTLTLEGEMAALGYPRAALFGFGIALAAYNVLSSMQAALRAKFGIDKVQDDLHNGSVPTLRARLTKVRPAQFYRGNVRYAQQAVGFVSEVATGAAALYDTTKSDSSNAGHDTAAFLGDIDWSADSAKTNDPLEYMKTLRDRTEGAPGSTTSSARAPSDPWRPGTREERGPIGWILRPPLRGRRPPSDTPLRPK